MFVLVISLVAIVIGLLILNKHVGNLVALKLSDQIAQLCTSVEYIPEEYEWINGNDKTMWCLKGWSPGSTPKETAKWGKTGKSRGRYENKFDKYEYKNRMSSIRFGGVFAIGSTNAWITDQKAIEKYDPEISQSKIKKLESDLKALEKEVGISE